MNATLKDSNYTVPHKFRLIAIQSPPSPTFVTLLFSSQGFIENDFNPEHLSAAMITKPLILYGVINVKLFFSIGNFLIAVVTNDLQSIKVGDVARVFG